MHHNYFQSTTKYVQFLHVMSQILIYKDGMVLKLVLEKLTGQEVDQIWPSTQFDRMICKAARIKLGVMLVSDYSSTLQM